MKILRVLNVVSYTGLVIVLIVSLFFETAIGQKAHAILTYFLVACVITAGLIEFLKRRKTIIAGLRQGRRGLQSVNLPARLSEEDNPSSGKM
jgi:hypothetical protein